MDDSPHLAKKTVRAFHAITLLNLPSSIKSSFFADSAPLFAHISVNNRLSRIFLSYCVTQKVSSQQRWLYLDVHVAAKILDFFNNMKSHDTYYLVHHFRKLTRNPSPLMVSDVAVINCLNLNSCSAVENDRGENVLPKAVLQWYTWTRNQWNGRRSKFCRRTCLM